MYNALAAISCARLLGVSLADAAAALETAHGAKGRVEPVPTDGDYSIFIDYAVTPDAIENVLTTLRGIAPKRLVMLFGAGGDRDRKNARSWESSLRTLPTSSSLRATTRAPRIP